MAVTVDSLRRFAVARSLFPPAELGAALDRLGFVQADPIRAPARAQDLTLRQRVAGYRAGDLDRNYAALNVEEDVFINYGFVTRTLHRLMHPRVGEPSLGRLQRQRADAILRFVGARDAVHPRDVDAEFAHGTVTNYWGGSSNATTHLLDLLHYGGRLRVVRREAGIRVYALQESVAPPDRTERVRRLDALVDVAVRKYAPLPAPSLANIVTRLRYAVPQWRRDFRAALERAKERLAQARVDGVDWYWPADERPETATTPEAVRLLAPFDPVVWDRRRFELLWGWAYRFEAYTPVKRRKFGYYALPMLWGDRVIGWANVSSTNATLQVDSGYFDGRRPRRRTFKRELDLELDRLWQFLK